MYSFKKYFANQNLLLSFSLDNVMAVYLYLCDSQRYCCFVTRTKKLEIAIFTVLSWFCHFVFSFYPKHSESTIMAKKSATTNSFTTEASTRPPTRSSSEASTRPRTSSPSEAQTHLSTSSPLDTLANEKVVKKFPKNLLSVVSTEAAKRSSTDRWYPNVPVFQID